MLPRLHAASLVLVGLVCLAVHTCYGNQLRADSQTTPEEIEMQTFDKFTLRHPNVNVMGGEPSRTHTNSLESSSREEETRGLEMPKSSREERKDAYRESVEAEKSGDVAGENHTTLGGEEESNGEGSHREALEEASSFVDEPSASSPSSGAQKRGTTAALVPEKKKGDTVIIYHPAHAELAEDVAKLLEDSGVKDAKCARGQDREDFFKADSGRPGVVWLRFDVTSDSPEILLRPDVLQGKHVVYIGDFVFLKDIFEQLAVLYHLQKQGWVPTENKKHGRDLKYETTPILSLRVIVPFCPVANMERTSLWRVGKNGNRDKQNKENLEGTLYTDVPTAEVFAALVSSSPPDTYSNLDKQIMFIDIHEYHDMGRWLNAGPGRWTNPGIREEDILTTGQGQFFRSAVPAVFPEMLGFISKHRKTAAAGKGGVVEAGPTNVVIGFPDAGAKARFGGLRVFAEESYPTVSCAKTRGISVGSLEVDPEDAKAVEDWKSRDVIIIDDFTNSGSTLKLAAQAFANLGAKKVWLYVTHPVFARKKHSDPPTFSKLLLKKKWDDAILADKIGGIFFTNTIPLHAEQVSTFCDRHRGKCIPHHVLSVKNVIADWISPANVDDDSHGLSDESTSSMVELEDSFGNVTNDSPGR